MFRNLVDDMAVGKNNGVVESLEQKGSFSSTSRP